MIFWISLALVAIIFIIAERLLPKPYKKWIPLIFICILTFFGMFRYQIGTDYDWYVELFYLSEIGDIYPEQSFILLVKGLRSLGLSYQSMFIVYELLIMGILALALRRFNKDSEYLMLMLVCFFTLQYFSSLNVIRQALSAVIILWAYPYARDKKFLKFLLSIIVASFIHISSSLGIIIYFLPRKQYAYVYYLVFFVVMFIIAKLNLVLVFFLKLSSILGIEYRYISYISDVDAVSSTGLFVIVQFILFSFGRLAIKRVSPDNYLILHIIFLGFLMNFLFTFSLPLMRLSKLFDYFWIFLYPIMIIYYNNLISMKFENTKIKLFLGYTLLAYLFYVSLSSLSMIPYDYKANWNNRHQSSMNIDYKFNFKLFDK